jgi:hypothetical protein
MASPVHEQTAARASSAWLWAWLLLAGISFAPAAYFAWQDAQEAGRAMRVELIEHYSLWETAPDYAGTPQAWTRFAAWLLNTDQLIERVRVKQGALADAIELDFRRDLVLEYGRIAGTYLFLWCAPLAALFSAGLWYRRRRRT